MNKISRTIEYTANTDIIFKYNGRMDAHTVSNGLYYMRARYYNPDIKRFVNGDILAESITDGRTSNRYAYVNAAISLVYIFVGDSVLKGDKYTDEAIDVGIRMDG